MAEALVRLELVILDEQLDVGGGQLAPAVRYYRVAITMRLHYWHLKKKICTYSGDSTSNDKNAGNGRIIKVLHSYRVVIIVQKYNKYNLMMYYIATLNVGCLKNCWAHLLV